MTCLSLHFLVPGIGPAGLPLPSSALDLTEPGQPRQEPDAADIAHELGRPDPGAVEYASWAACPPHTVR